MADLRAEGLVMQQLSGHCCFPYLYGFTEAGALIMEHICSNVQMTKNMTQHCVHLLKQRAQIERVGSILPGSLLRLYHFYTIKGFCTTIFMVKIS